MVREGSARQMPTLVRYPSGGASMVANTETGEAEQESAGPRRRAILGNRSAAEWEEMEMVGVRMRQRAAAIDWEVREDGEWWRVWTLDHGFW